MNVPLLGLMFYIEYKDRIALDDSKSYPPYSLNFIVDLRELLKQLYEKHLDLTIDESIEYEDWVFCFEKLHKRVNEIAAFFPTNAEHLHAYCGQKIKSLRSLKLSTAYLLSEGKFEEALEKVYALSLEVSFNYSSS